jgi:hypothetical protein
MKSYWVKVIETREAYVSIEAENEAEAREEVLEMDEEAFHWESHGIDIESIDEEEADEEPSL